MRPIIMRFYDYKEKIEVIKNCKKLKGTKISVSDDFSTPTLAKRQKLWESAKQEKDAGSQVRLVYDKIVIDKETYVWDDVKACRTKLGKTKASQRNSD